MLEELVSRKILENAKEKEVSDLKIGTKLITGTVISSSSETQYTPSVRLDGTFRCGCPYSGFHEKLCSHIAALLLKADEQAKPFIEALTKRPKLPFTYYPANLEPFNDLIGGLPIGSALGIYGPFTSGKTILTLQLAFSVNGNALFIDTEGSGYSYHYWTQRLGELYNRPTVVECVQTKLEEENKKVKLSIQDISDSDEGTFYVMDVRGLDKILALHGRPVKIQLKGEKFSLSPREHWYSDIWDIPLAAFIQKHNIKYLVYDSISQPLAGLISERHNFPVRNNACNLWLTQAERLAEFYNLIVIGTHHETKDPTVPFSLPKALGGGAVGYNFKFQVYLGLLTQSPKESRRVLKINRHPYKPPFAERKLLMLTDNGFKEIEKEE